MIQANGRSFEGRESMTIRQFLEREGYDITRTVVEQNGEILMKSSYDERTLKDGDVIEVVSFVGGG